MEITEWPENSFTKEVIEPQYGKADYVIDDSENGRYSVFYSEISMPQAEEYVVQMESLGYKKEAEYDEDLASGIVLIRDKTTLNISLTEGGLAISIAIEQ